MDTHWRDQTLEAAILNDIALDEPWALVEAFSEIVRLSGSPEEAAAVEMIVDKLTSWGIPVQVDHPVCLISLPGPATLRIVGDDRQLTVKTPAFSPQTGDSEVEAELVYVPGQQALGINELFSDQRSATDVDLRGKIVMTEGLGIAARGFDLATSGAVGAIFINPGERIHEGITTTTWGSPDLDSQGRVPPVPILTINKHDGQYLIDKLNDGPVSVAFTNTVDTAWRPIPIITAEIRGSRSSDEFVLFHGHLDSWHVGVGDNATGDATLLELARVFHEHRDSLERTFRVAWWSGHSHGRYAGSTWYADAHAHDLLENCVAHVNVDSPGCRWATVYEQMAWMAEAEEFCRHVIRDVTGQESSSEGHVLRAGDCSFNNLGITTCFMLSSTMPQDVVSDNGYYPVGGCGGNIAWHTEDDTLEIADRDNLLRDMRVYAALLLRLLNAPVVPFDYRATLAEMKAAARQYQEAAGQRFSLEPTLAALADLESRLDDWYTSGAPNNAVQLPLSRVLVNLNYTADGRFKQDPAKAIPALPALAVAREYATADDELQPVITQQLLRAQNHVVWELQQAQRLIES